MSLHRSYSRCGYLAPILAKPCPDPHHRAPVPRTCKLVPRRACQSILSRLSLTNAHPTVLELPTCIVQKAAGRNRGTRTHTYEWPGVLIRPTHQCEPSPLWHIATTRWLAGPRATCPRRDVRPPSLLLGLPTPDISPSCVTRPSQSNLSRQKW